MPSDDPRIAAALEALQPALEGYRTSAATAAAEVEALLTARTGSRNGGQSPGLAAELGPLGAGRIDAERLAALLTDQTALDRAALDAVTAAAQVLLDIGAAKEPDVVIRLPAGANLSTTVARALARIGRAFGAAHVVALARAGRYRKREHAAWLRSYPFARWTRREREVGPPLIVALNGADLHAGALVEFLDGRQKIVLLVGEPAPPAPLVRLITPGVFVAQTHDGSGLDQLPTWEGPGVLAWMSATAAQFAHDPRRGANLWNRLQITKRPTEPLHALDEWSVALQMEELKQLAALAEAPPLAPAAPTAQAEAAVPPEPADVLAAWLLSQADVRGPQ